MSGHCIVTVPSERTTRVHLVGEFDLDESQEMKASLLAALATSDRLEIDMSEVEFAGSICLQGLLEAHQAATSRGASFQVVAVSPVVLRLLTVTDLLEHFGLGADGSPHQ